MRDPQDTTTVLPEQVRRRFWAKVSRNKPDECWAWTGSTHPFGYGTFNAGGGRYIMAHRVSWMLAYGPIPDGACVCHRCDVPACVNPAHLFIGSRLDNMRDMWAKGRAAPGHVVGEAHGLARLTENTVRAIRAYHRATGAPHREIAERFGVSRRHVCSIVNRKAWAHVAD